MADSRTIILRGPSQRQHAHQTIDQAPPDSVVEVKLPRRTVPQNDIMWALVEQVRLVNPGNRNLNKDGWKALFMSYCGFKCEFAVSLDGQGVVPIGFRSSGLRKAEFSVLIEGILQWGTENGVVFDEVG